MKKAFPIIALVLVALLVIAVPFVRFSYHRTREDQGLTLSCNSSTFFVGPPRTIKLDTYSKIAIVPLPCSKTASVLQTQVVNKLQEALSKKDFVYHMQRSSSGASYSTSMPESVVVYASEKEAIKHRSDYIIFVEPKLWKYSGPFFRRNWQAGVVFDAGPPGFTRVVEFNSTKTREPYYTFKLTAEGTGTVKGIFSTSYLTSKVAEVMAKEAVKQMVKGLKEFAEKYQTD